MIVAPGPTYNGKTVSDWGNALQSSDVSDAASTNLTAIGKPAVPYLIKAAEWKPSIRDKLSSFIGRHGRGIWAYRLRCLIDPEFAKWRKSAYDALQKIDPWSVSDLRPAPAK